MGVVENVPRRRLRLEGGPLAVMSAADTGLGVAGVKTYAAGHGGASFVLVLFDAQTDQTLAMSRPIGSDSSARAQRAVSPRSTWRAKARRASA